MAALYNALEALSPTTAADLPAQQDLSGYLARSLQDANVLISSIPPPPGSQGPLSPDQPLQALHKEWKPVKVGAGENPHGFAVFKLPAKDGRGTWFARRSVHGNLSFSRFWAGLQREFEFGEQQGASVRGLGRTRQVDWKRCPLGHLEGNRPLFLVETNPNPTDTVNHLFAQFPGPTAPRDFVTASIASSVHLDDIGHDAPGATDLGDTGPRQRQFTMMSRPLQDHPECVEREGYVRGQFESVEFIREVPADFSRRDDRPRRSVSTPNVPGLDEERLTGRKRGKTLTGSASDEERNMDPRSRYH